MHLQPLFIVFLAGLVTVSCVCEFSSGSVVEQKVYLGTLVNQIWTSVGETEDPLKNQKQVKLRLASSLGDGLHLRDERDRILALLEIDARVARQNCGDSVNDTNFDWSAFRNFPASFGFLVSAKCRFLSEILGDGRNLVVSELAAAFDSVDLSGANITLQQKDGFLRSVLELLQNQTETNPPRYVSHGADHSIRAMSFATALLNEPSFLLPPTLQSKYGIVPQNQKFLVMINTVLHDVGYIYLGSLNKFLHAPLGRAVSDLLIRNQVGERIIRALAGPGLADLLFTDFMDAINYHNFDSQPCINLNNTESSCTYANTGVNPYLSSFPNPIFRTYTPADSTQKPLIFALRICDNLDAEYTRLTPVQRDVTLMKYLLRLYVDKSLRIATFSNSPTYSTVLSVAQNRSVAYAALNLTGADSELIDVVTGTNTESFLHFYSNWILQKLTLKDNVLQITIRENVPNELKFSNHVGVGLYQINRLATSMYSLSVNGTAFVDRLSINISYPISGGRSLFPLRAFTKRSTFSDGTPQAPLICAQYCNAETRLLSISPEPCLDDQNKIATFCNNSQFGSSGAFVDLTYLSEQEGTSAPDTTEASDAFRLICGAQIVLAILALLRIA